MPPNWEDVKPDWFDDKSAYRHQKFGVDPQTGREYVEYEDAWGTYWRQQHDPATGASYKAQYFDPNTSHYHTPSPSDKFLPFEDVRGVWWEYRYDPEVGDEVLMKYGGGREGWRYPKEGEEPIMLRSQAQGKREAPPDDPNLPDPDLPDPPYTPPDVPPDLPPGVDLDEDHIVTHGFPDGSQQSSAFDQYGREWHWGRDAQGNYWGNAQYVDKAGNWHEPYLKDGVWMDSWIDEDGNEHHGQMDRYGKSWEPNGAEGRFGFDEDGHWDRMPRTNPPKEGGDQEGQPPIIDPNAQPVPMPSFPGDQEGEEGPPPYGQFPMGKDPDTGQWVPGTIDPDTGEFHPFESGADEGGEGDQPPILDPNAQPMPMPSPDQFTTLEARLVPPDSPALIPGSPEYDPKASPLGPDNVTIDPDLLDPAAPGPTLDPALFDLSAPGPTLDPALLDLNAPGPTLDPALLDPNAPGPTLDAALLDPAAPGPTIDPAQLERGNVEPGSSGGGAEQPAEVTAQGFFTDPSLTETAHPEPSTAPGQDLDDPAALG